ncbi:hypothetical protein [Aeromonas cavernicola]|uniref:Uncharacterized protein n=1 Tax=Aeromonas cavernicola TaxID=1006623 RepID=A0A2H9U734_9GAMM|nr:hypothetical protein [Aeromonas cavernicola]PJG59845.1 hypothetical protein CUC53_05120 [Aeromonas cavernicola]
MREPIKVISLRAVREALGKQDSFSGVENGVAKLQQGREQKALVILVALATQDIASGKTHTVDEVLARLWEARA